MPGVFRWVRCPKCRAVLPEVTALPFYRCGGCGATLKAKNHGGPPALPNLPPSPEDVAAAIPSPVPSNSATNCLDAGPVADSESPANSSDDGAGTPAAISAAITDFAELPPPQIPPDSATDCLQPNANPASPANSSDDGAGTPAAAITDFAELPPPQIRPDSATVCLQPNANPESPANSINNGAGCSTESLSTAPATEDEELPTKVGAHIIESLIQSLDVRGSIIGSNGSGKILRRKILEKVDQFRDELADLLGPSQTSSKENRFRRTNSRIPSISEDISKSHRRNDGLRSRLPRMASKHHYRPVLGGTPFVICSTCFCLIMLPFKFADAMTGTYRLRCASCSQVLLYIYGDSNRQQRSCFGSPDITGPPDGERQIHVSPSSSFSEERDPLIVSLEQKPRSGPKLHELMGYATASGLLRRSIDSIEAGQRTVDPKGKGIMHAHRGRQVLLQ